MAKKTKKTSSSRTIGKFVSKGILRADTNLTSDIQTIINYYESYVFPNFLRYYKLYAKNMDYRKPYIDEWQSNQSVGIVEKTIDSIFAHLYDNIMKLYVSGQSDTKTETDKAKAVEDYIIYNMQVGKAKKNLYDIIKDALVTGEGYGKFEWKNEYKRIEYLKMIDSQKEIIERKEYTVDRLQYTKLIYKSVFDIFVDPGCKDINDARFIIERKILPINSVKKNYGAYADITDKDIDYMKRNYYHFIGTDYDYYKNSILSGQTLPQTLDEINNSYTFDGNEYCEVIEYRTDEKLKVLINGYLIYDDINPYPLKDLPYGSMYYKKQPGTIRAEGLAKILENIELVGNALLNSYIDEVRLKSVPVLLKVAGPSQFQSINNIIDLKPGEVITIDEPGALQPLQLGGANINVIDLLQFLEGMAFQLVGLNEIVLGGAISQGKVLRSAADVTQRVNGFKVRVMPLFDSMNALISKYGKFTTVFGRVYLDEKQSIKIFDDEKKKFLFSSISPEDLDGEFDVMFDENALRTATREIRIQQVMQFLSIAGNMATDPITGMPIIDTNKLLEETAQLLDIDQSFLMSLKDSQKKVLMNEEAKAKMQSDLQKRLAKFQETPPAELGGNQEALGLMEGMTAAMGGQQPQQPAPLEEVSGDIVTQALQTNE